MPLQNNTKGTSGYVTKAGIKDKKKRKKKWTHTHKNKIRQEKKRKEQQQTLLVTCTTHHTVNVLYVYMSVCVCVLEKLFSYMFHVLSAEIKTAIICAKESLSFTEIAINPANIVA